jgi:hypothetical protein
MWQEHCMTAAGGVAAYFGVAADKAAELSELTELNQEVPDDLRSVSFDTQLFKQHMDSVLGLLGGLTHLLETERCRNVLGTFGRKQRKQKPSSLVASRTDSRLFKRSLVSSAVSQEQTRRDRADRAKAQKFAQHSRRGVSDLSFICSNTQNLNAHAINVDSKISLSVAVSGTFW